MSPALEALYRASRQADDAYHAELCRAYPNRHPGDVRYGAHADPTVAAAARAYVDASKAWIDALQAAQREPDFWIRDCDRCGGHLGAQNPDRICGTCQWLDRLG